MLNIDLGLKSATIYHIELTKYLLKASILILVKITVFLAPLAPLRSVGGHSAQRRNEVKTLFFHGTKLFLFRIKANRFYNFPKTPKMATFPWHPKKIPPF